MQTVGIAEAVIEAALDSVIAFDSVTNAELATALRSAGVGALGISNVRLALTGEYVAPPARASGDAATGRRAPVEVIQAVSIASSTCVLTLRRC